MARSTVLVLCVWLAVAQAQADLKFPENFQFGVATSSYQIEGAWNVSDKAASVWDFHTHNHPELVAGGGNGDVACNSYHQWKEDVQMTVDLGLDFYRFSISWSRLMPTGFTDRISKDGQRYYNDLINGLLEAGVKPVVTLYHWELPQRLQNLGGWANPMITDWFADYARVVYQLFGDRVGTWLTLNEPIIYCHFAYNTGILAPTVLDPQIGAYLCSKHALIAHAKAWRVYDKEFRYKYNGKVSITNQIMWYEGNTDADKELGELAMEYCGGIFSHPIFSEEGGWPLIIEKLLAEKSQSEGFESSKLPPFTPEEIELVKGTYDFMGLNYYSARVARRPQPGETVGSWPLFGIPDLDLVVEPRAHWINSGLDWFYIYPEGIRNVLKWLKDKYNPKEIMILENGLADDKRTLNDGIRVKYYEDHLRQVLLSIKEDGVNITAYTAWSLMDNFEWHAGYTVKFGLYDVNFDNPRLPRNPKKSAKYYASVVKTRSLLHSEVKYEL